MDVDYDVIIIGAGVVGLAVARALAERHVSSVLVVEKEDDFGRSVSSRNSEVIHSGIYYPEDSLKARYCCLGRDKLYSFCRENDVWYSKCGKLVVAHNDQEKKLEQLYRRAQINEVPEIYLMSQKEIRALEPDVIAKLALFVGCAGLISTHELMSAFSRYSAEGDHDLLFKASVVGVEPRGNHYLVAVEGPGEATNQVSTNWVVNAAGLWSDRVADFLWGSDRKDTPSLHYLKGSYFKLSSKWSYRFEHLIYPLPDEEYGTLGIHLCLDREGDARLGPDATPIVDRKEDYTVDVRSLDMFYTEGKQFIPSLEREDLRPDFAGIRPRLALPDGDEPDFYIRHEQELGYPGWINLIGIDSPGLTAAIAIGEDVAAWIVEG